MSLFTLVLKGSNIFVPELYDKSGQGDDDLDEGEVLQVSELDPEQKTDSPEIAVTATENVENVDTKTAEKSENVESKLEEVSTEEKVAEISEHVEKVKIGDQA